MCKGQKRGKGRREQGERRKKGGEEKEWEGDMRNTNPSLLLHCCNFIACNVEMLQVQNSPVNVTLYESDPI